MPPVSSFKKLCKNALPRYLDFRNLPATLPAHVQQLNPSSRSAWNHFCSCHGLASKVKNGFA
jgi:hypothetical protein